MYPFSDFFCCNSEIEKEKKNYWKEQKNKCQDCGTDMNQTLDFNVTIIFVNGFSYDINLYQFKNFKKHNGGYFFC